MIPSMLHDLHSKGHRILGEYYSDHSRSVAGLYLRFFLGSSRLELGISSSELVLSHVN